MPDPKDAAKGLGDLVTQGLGFLQQGVNTLAGALVSGDSAVHQLDAALTGQPPPPGPVQVPASAQEVAERVVSLVRQGQGEAQRTGDPQAPGVVAPFREAMRLLAQTSLPVDTSSLTGLIPSPGGMIRGGLRALRGSMTLSRLASGTGSLEDMEEIVSLAEDLVGQAQRGIKAVQVAAPAPAPRVRQEIKAPQRGVSTEQTIAYQKEQIKKEMLLLERHLQQRCKIAGKACDCCEKHPLVIEGLAEEALGMTADPGYAKLIAWCRRIAPFTTEAASASGQYDEQYPKLAVESRELRKEVLGSEERASPHA